MHDATRFTPIDIRKGLLDAGVTQAAMARALGCKPSLVFQVTRHLRATPRIRRKIADVLGMSYREVWGVDDPGVDHIRPPGRSGVTGLRHAASNAGAA